MKPAGYLYYDKQGYQGERGIGFDYVMAGNGLWIESEGKLMAARVPVASCKVKGLPDLEPVVRLRHGKIPAACFDLALGEMLKPEIMVGDMAQVQTPFGSTLYMPSEDETYVGIVYETGYHVRLPEQTGLPAKVQFLEMDNVAMDLHSHGHYSTFFSGTDDSDEQGLRLYTVVGNCDKNPPGVRVRVGVYGYWLQIPWSDVFEGELRGAVEVWDPEPEDNFEQWADDYKKRLETATELIKEAREGLDRNGVQDKSIGDTDQGGHSRGWLRWDRFFRRRGSVPAAPKQ